MKGRCLCNSVLFELRSEIQNSYYCHCRDCQLQSGSAFQVFGIVDYGSIVLRQGKLSEFTQEAASGFDMIREFCTVCGTPLFVRSTRFPEIQMILISALLDSQSIKPAFQIWCSSKVSWAEAGHELKRFARGQMDDQ